MSNILRPPNLGPIVGHTTHTSARMWIRGSAEEGQRTIGVAAQVINGRATKASAQYFRLHREHDRTGFVDFLNLAPETSYKFKLGSLALDSVDPNLIVEDEELRSRLPKPEQWIRDLDVLPDDQALASLTTFPAPSPGPLSFIFGSCRYPGILWQKKRADIVFGSIRERFLSSPEDRKPRFLLMVGDQIYADMFNRAIPLGLADTEEEFRERYLSAFGSPNMRALLRGTPTYMILDDHEIEDNWVQGRIKDRNKRTLFNVAISAYMSYQWSHGPRTYGKQLHYKFECAGSPFFVLDGRTQRMRDDDDKVLIDNHMLGFPRQAFHDASYKGQIDEVCDWLIEQQNAKGDAPKFLVSPSVFVPNDVAALSEKGKWKSDSWPAFPETRKQLLRNIVDNSVQNVIFLSGDIHCSNIAQIEFEANVSGSVQRLPLKAFSITSSAFYWPFPFADGNPLSFIHDSRQQNDPFAFGTSKHGEVIMHYRASNFEQEDNFTQIDFDGSKMITSTMFDKKGEMLQQSTLTLA